MKNKSSLKTALAAIVVALVSGCVPTVNYNTGGALGNGVEVAIDPVIGWGISIGKYGHPENGDTDTISTYGGVNLGIISYYAGSIRRNYTVTDDNGDKERKETTASFVEWGLGFAFFTSITTVYDKWSKYCFDERKITNYSSHWLRVRHRTIDDPHEDERYTTLGLAYTFFW